MVHEMLMKLGIPTYSDTYFTKLDGSTPVKIGQTMPKPIGWIYGISVDTDSVLPTDQNQVTITIADAAVIYLQFKIGTDLFINNYRIDKLVFVQVTTPIYSNQQRYFPVNIPNVTDLKESYYANPTGVGGGGTIKYLPLTLHYIDKKSYDLLIKKGYFFDGVEAMPLHPSHKDHPKNKQLPR